MGFRTNIQGNCSHPHYGCEDKYAVGQVNVIRDCHGDDRVRGAIGSKSISGELLIENGLPSLHRESVQYRLHICRGWLFKLLLKLFVIFVLL